MRPRQVCDWPLSVDVDEGAGAGSVTWPVLGVYWVWCIFDPCPVPVRVLRSEAGPKR